MGFCQIGSFTSGGGGGICHFFHRGRLFQNHGIWPRKALLHSYHHHVAMEPDAEQYVANPERIPAELELNWDNDARNPRNWSWQRKTAMTAIVSCIGFVW